MELWQQAERKRQELVDVTRQTAPLAAEIKAEVSAKKQTANELYVSLRRSGLTPDAAISEMAAQYGVSRAKITPAMWPSIYDEDEGTEESLAEAIRMAS